MSSSHSQTTATLLALCLTCLTANQVPGQPPTLSSAPTATELSIEEASAKACTGRILDALEQYQRILDTAPDELVPVILPRAGLYGLSHLAGAGVLIQPVDRSHWLPARWVCHLHLSRLPWSARKLYRERIDGQAAKRLEHAKTRSDDGGLETLLADFYVSAAAEEALLILGNRAFERGHFDRAAWYWSMLQGAHENNISSTRLYYPDAKIDPANLLARLLLVKLFRQETGNMRAEISAFRKKYPTAEGLLAGRAGNYSATLEELLAQPHKTRLAEPAATAAGWNTFAGSPARNSLVCGKLPYYWPNQPTWQATIPAGVAPKRATLDELPAPPTDHPRGLAFFPVLAHGYAYLADATSVYAYDLRTGSRSTVFDLRKTVLVPGLDSRIPARSALRYTLTVANDYLYVRLGTQALRVGREDEKADDEPVRDNYSCVVCFGPLRHAQPNALPVRWVLRPPTVVKDTSSIFEGTPIVLGTRLYALTWRRLGGDAISSIVCYQNLDRRDPPELLWQKDVGKAVSPASGEATTLHQLLTLADSRIVYCNNTGSILALEAQSGMLAWAYQYRRKERMGETVPIGLNPCLFDGARIFAAPTDTDAVICLDAFTGRWLWDQEGLQGTQFLGVTRDTLICTVRGPVKGIRGINVQRGTSWAQHDDGGTESFGRGFVSPDVVVWPTKHGIHFLRPEDGASLRQPIPGMFGNLCYADGFLVVTTPTEIWGFMAERQWLDSRKRQVENDPTDLRAQMHLALAEADAGEFAAARQRFLHVAGMDPSDLRATQRWRELVLDHLHSAIRSNDEPSIAAVLNDPEVRADAELHALVLVAQTSKAFAAGKSDVAQKLLQETVELPSAQRLALRDGHGFLRRLDDLASITQTFHVEHLPSHKREIKKIVHETATKELSDVPEALQPKNITPTKVSGLLPLRCIGKQQDSTLFAAAGRHIYRFQEESKQIVHVGDVFFDPEVAATYEDSLIVAGAGGIVALPLKQGGKEWQFQPGALAVCATPPNVRGKIDAAASPLPLPSFSIRNRDEPTQPPHLCAFRMVENHFFCLVAGRELLCLDVRTGQNRWQQQGPSFHGEWGAHYRPHYFASKSAVMLQTESGRLCSYALADGAPQDNGLLSEMPWLQDPLLVGQDDMVGALDPETLVRIQLNPYRKVWIQKMAHPVSGTGAYPQLRLHGSHLLVLWPRTHGQELECFNSATGTRSWKEEIFLGTAPYDLHNAGLDDSTLHLLHEGKLRTLALATGKMTATFPLAETATGTWKVQTLRTTLLLYPTQALPQQPSGNYEARLLAGGLGLPRLAGWLKNRYNGWMMRTLPLVVVNRTTGTIQQRCGLPAYGPAVSVAPVSAGWCVFVGNGAWYVSAK